MLHKLLSLPLNLSQLAGLLHELSTHTHTRVNVCTLNVEWVKPRVLFSSKGDRKSVTVSSLFFLTTVATWTHPATAQQPEMMMKNSWWPDHHKERESLSLSLELSGRQRIRHIFIHPAANWKQITKMPYAAMRVTSYHYTQTRPNVDGTAARNSMLCVWASWFVCDDNKSSTSRSLSLSL